MSLVQRWQRIELDGRTYEVGWYIDGKARVAVLTKRGPRTLNGRGRAYRPELMARVIAAARAADPGRPVPHHGSGPDNQ